MVMESLTPEQVQALNELDEVDRACLRAAYRGLTSKQMIREGIPRSKSNIDSRLSEISRRLGARGRYGAARLYVEFEAAGGQLVANELPIDTAALVSSGVPPLAGSAPLGAREQSDEVDFGPPSTDSAGLGPSGGPMAGSFALEWARALLRLGGLEGRASGFDRLPGARILGSRRPLDDRETGGDASFAPSVGTTPSRGDGGADTGVGLPQSQRRGGRHALVALGRLLFVVLIAIAIAAFASGLVAMMIGLQTYFQNHLPRL